MTIIIIIILLILLVFQTICLYNIANGIGALANALNLTDKVTMAVSLTKDSDQTTLYAGRKDTDEVPPGPPNKFTLNSGGTVYNTPDPRFKNQAKMVGSSNMNGTFEYIQAPAYREHWPSPIPASGAVNSLNMNAAPVTMSSGPYPASNNFISPVCMRLLKM